MSADPVLHLLAGPNGAGKSTFVDRVLFPWTDARMPFVNADVIAAREWPDDQAAHAYDASRMAADLRNRLIDERTSFITETVFSHPSKLDLVGRAQSAGYQVRLHLIMVPEQVSVHRVAYRVERGGHDVPADKILERHRRLWRLVAQARERADLTFVYDNSRAPEPFRLVAEYRRGVLTKETSWPSWAPPEL